MWMIRRPDAPPLIFWEWAVLQQWLAQHATTQPITVERYDWIKRESVIYYGPGGRPQPPLPPQPIPTRDETWHCICRA
jgi:hypothetical protein